MVFDPGGNFFLGPAHCSRPFPNPLVNIFLHHFTFTLSSVVSPPLQTGSVSPPLPQLCEPWKGEAIDRLEINSFFQEEMVQPPAQGHIRTEQVLNPAPDDHPTSD